MMGVNPKTSDLQRPTRHHGDALGEWEHKPGMVRPKMRSVPCSVYRCTDERTVEPDYETALATKKKFQEWLEELGDL
jgi:hypothetical protein